MMRVLVATDGSAAANVGVGLVAAIQWPSDAVVRVVASVDVGPAPLQELQSEARQQARAVVDAACDRLAERDLRVVTAILVGRPAAAILDAAEALDANVIVIGSRGHGAIRAMLLGSVSAEVVDHSRVPVLVARGLGLERVILAWDGSDSARAAADLLRTWPIFSGTVIGVLTVDDTRIPWSTGLTPGASPELIETHVQSLETMRREHDRSSREMVDALRAVGLNAQPLRRNGDPASEIVAAAREWNADLVITGTHGRTGLTRLVLGSVARNVLHHAPCSVLISRQPAHLRPELNAADPEWVRLQSRRDRVLKESRLLEPSGQIARPLRG